MSKQLQEVCDSDAAAVEVARRVDNVPLGEQREEVDDTDDPVAVAAIPRARGRLDAPHGEEQVGVTVERAEGLPERVAQYRLADDLGAVVDGVR